MDYELLRNGSGYYDPTAYEALKNFKGVTKTMIGFRHGEIYEVETLHGYRQGIIVSSNDRVDSRYINVIIMNDKQLFDIDIPIVCQGIRYACPEKVSLVHVDKIGNFIKLATDEELAQIDAGIAKALGLQYMESKECEAVEPVKYIEPMELPLPAPDDEAGMYVKLTIAEFEEMVASKTEAELKAKIYKDLHEKLLDKVIQG